MVKKQSMQITVSLHEDVHPELFNELKDVGAKRRQERLKMLAMMGLVGQTGQAPVLAGRQSYPAGQQPAIVAEVELPVDQDLAKKREEEERVKALEAKRKAFKKSISIE